MPRLEASGQAAEQSEVHAHRGCLEETLSTRPASPEALVDDLVARIAERYVLRADQVRLVLNEAKYVELITRGTIDEPPEPEPEPPPTPEPQPLDTAPPAVPSSDFQPEEPIG